MSTSNRIKLLLLEDDHIDVKLINDIVRSAKTFHYEIHHVDDLLKAEELLRKFPFDVVLLDVSLPPGQDLAEAISHINRVSPATPIVALDNEFNEALAARTAQLGVQDYACKLDLNAHVFERIMRYAIERNKFIYSLKLSEEREKNLLHAAGEGILGIDENGDCTFINPAALAILGYRHEDDLLGKHLHSIIHHTRPDGTHCPDHLCAIYQAFRQSKPIHVEDDVFWRADGSSVSVDYRSVPLEYGGHCHGSVVTFSDITERKQILSDLMSAQEYLEQRVKERTRHLEQANALLKKESLDRLLAQEAERKAHEFNTALIETLGALVIVLDGKGRITLFNRACEQTTGYSFEEVKGKVFWDIFLLPEELAAVKKVFADLHHNLLPNSYKNYWITRNGNRRYISWSNTVLVDDNRQVEHIIGTGLDITEQYAMEQALIKSEHSYRILASNIPAAVYRSTLIDNKFQTEFFNDMMQTMTGYAASEMPSDEACSFGKFILDQDLEKVRKQIRQAVDNKSTFEIEYRIRHKNGDIKFFRDRGRPVYDEDGNITHIDGTIIDDTERILVNNALKESENKFRALTEKSMVGVYLIQDGRFRYVNPHFSAIFGYDQDKLLDMNAMHFVAREDRCGLVKTIRSQIGNRSSFHTTFHCFTREGKRIDVETYGNRTVFRGMPAIIGTLMDITKRKIIEQALQEQMLRYEQILQTSMDGFLLINASGKILDVNPAYCQMLGYNSKDILDLNIMDIDIQMTPQNFYKKMKQLAQKGLASYETQNRRKDGSIIDVEISISVMNSNGGWIAAIFVRDITQRKQQESSEKQSLLDLAHASRLSTMGEMATEFAHELNQPLSAISTYSNVALKLLNAGIIDQDLTEALQGIYGQANRAGEIIRSLRDFIGKRESAVAITDINELIRLVIRLVKSETTMNQILINLELSEQLPEIVTEKILIEQVLLNITRNAIEALSEITAERQLHIRSFMNSQNMIEIKITDNGPGLPYEEPDQVFDAFYSTKDHGMGMGLAISRSIIESHGGKLWARNNPDRGACFSFTLPVMIEE